MMREVIKKSDLPKINFSNTERAKATEYNPNGMITSLEKITEMFERPLQALETIGVTKDDMQQITRDYVKIICFDYLTNQTDRNDGNYGILFKDGRASFAPLIDCDYILHDPSDKDNDINFTYSQRCDRDTLMSFVASKYPELVQDFLNTVENNKAGISKIISDCFSTEMQEKYGNITSKNIDGLRRIIEFVKQEKDNQTQKSQSQTAYFHDQKSEFAMEQINSGKESLGSTNKVIHKNDIISTSKNDGVVNENENVKEALGELEITPETEKENSQNLE